MMNTTSAQSDEPPAAPIAARKRLHGRRWLWLILLAVLGAGAYWVYLQNAPSPSDQAKGGSEQGKGGKRFDPAGRVIPVVAAAVKKGDVAVYLGGLGSVLPRNIVTVKSRVDGQLMRVHFNEGQIVKAGELLAEIDPRPFQVQLAQAEGQMARDQALLNNAQADVARYRTLFAQDSIAKQQLDTQEALVRQYEGALKVDQGQIDNARLQLVYTRITAPISGRAGLRQVDAGNIVRASDAGGLVVIAQLNPITVVFTLPEDSLPLVQRRLQAGGVLPVDAYDREQKIKLGSGRLLTMDNQIDAGTGTIRLKAQFPNENGILFPNQFVNARMLLDTRRDAVLAPTAAIQRGVQGTFVYVVKDNGTVTVRPVKVGPSEGENIAIEEGLSVGEQVVVDGADKLREGAKVTLTARGGSAGSGERKKRPPGDGPHKKRGEQ